MFVGLSQFGSGPVELPFTYKGQSGVLRFAPSSKPGRRNLELSIHSESGLSTWAQNGQYLGLFQMGSSERALYGHGSTAYAQVLAAHRYFSASGRDWSPGQCKPG